MEMTRRQARIARIIKQVASRVILFELADPRIGMVTVTKVEPSRDNRHAKVFVSVMGKRADISKTLRGIQGARAIIQGEVAKHLTTRFAPVLTFVEDTSIKQSIHISRLIRQALKENNREDTDETGEGEGEDTGRQAD